MTTKFEYSVKEHTVEITHDKDATVGEATKFIEQLEKFVNLSDKHIVFKSCSNFPVTFSI
jgi:hypothetical protein